MSSKITELSNGGNLLSTDIIPVVRDGDNVKVNLTQSAIVNILGSSPSGSGGVSIPSGMIMPYAGNSAPSGWLLCNGAAVSRSGETANLFQIIGTTYGSGNGSTTFNLPNLNGLFPRGVGSQTVEGKVINGGALGNRSSDRIASHSHALSPETVVNVTSGQGGEGQEYSTYTINNNQKRNMRALRAKSVPQTVLTNAAGSGSETRPAFIALNFCIKI